MEFKIEIPEGHEIDKTQSTFEKIVFKKVLKSIIERVKTERDVFKILTESDEEVVQYRKLEKADVSKAILSQQFVVCLVKALNEGWKPNWNNSNEYKYSIWFGMRNKIFGYDCIRNWASRGDVSARLLFKNKELAEYAGKQFTEKYKNFMLQD